MPQTQTHAIAKEPGWRFAPPIPDSPCPNTWDIAQIELNAYIQQQADEVAPEAQVTSDS